MSEHKTRGLSILGYNRELDRLEADIKLLSDALMLAMDDLTGEYWLAADVALQEVRESRPIPKDALAATEQEGE